MTPEEGRAVVAAARREGRVLELVGEMRPPRYQDDPIMKGEVLMEATLPRRPPRLEAARVWGGYRGQKVAEWRGQGGRSFTLFETTYPGAQYILLEMY